jgi:hypothetical protein
MTKRYIISATLGAKYYYTKRPVERYAEQKSDAFIFDDLVECCKVLTRLKEMWHKPNRPEWSYEVVK